MDKNTQEIIDLDQQYYLDCFGRRIPLVIDHGDGCYVYDEAGNAWLDLVGGIAVNVLGHGNAALANAIAEQAQAVIHCSNLYYNRPQTELAVALCERTGYDKAFFANSGAEANEAAMKLARAYYYKNGSDRYEIITASHSFHGRTLATLTATGQEKFHKGFTPLPAGFKYVPFNDLAALREAVTPQTAAIMLEPIQGESGIWPADPAYLQAVRQLCDEEGILLILDEIQSGMGRTGKFLAQELYGIRADIVSLAKGLGGGVPIGAILSTAEVATGFTPGMHGTTFGGGPLACRAALTVLDEYDRLGLLENAATVGSYFKDRLSALAADGLITAIRGEGLMIGFDLPVLESGALRDKLFDRGILVNNPAPSTIRLLPALILTKADVDDFIAILADVLA